MQRIYKYILKPKDEQILEIPAENILSIQSQFTDIVVYAAVDEEKPKNKFLFKIYGTGHEINENLDYFIFLGTVKLYDGALMWHVFYKKL